MVAAVIFNRDWKGQGRKNSKRFILENSFRIGEVNPALFKRNLNEHAALCFSYNELVLYLKTDSLGTCIEFNLLNTEPHVAWLDNGVDGPSGQITGLG